jgi:hypothetical protein
VIQRKLGPRMFDTLQLVVNIGQIPHSVIQRKLGPRMFDTL